MTKRSIVHAAALLLMAAGVCAARAASAQSSAERSPNTLSTEERAAGWRLLFDGRSTKGWRGYHEQSMPSGWKVVNGTLEKDSSTGDIITADQFANFELVVDWKIGVGGNSGIFYRATEEYPKVYWSGPEYQLLDDANAPDGKSRLTAAGSAYALYPSPGGIVKPAGEWNTTRLVVNGAHVQHWLNGKKLLEYELWSPEWEAKVKATKFAAWPNYGRAHRGHLGIQGDHAASLELRNVKIKVLP